MNRRKTRFLKEKADKKLIVRHYLFQALIILMFAVVLYDSFTSEIPFYYICYLLLGLLVGRILSVAEKVKHSEENDSFTIELSTANFIIVLVLLSGRFIFGKYLLDLAHVLWATDALYLIYIGIYWAKSKSVVRQVDEMIYGFIVEKK